MQRLIANVTIMSKPLRYTENRSILNYKQIANITSLNLNSHKLPKQPVPDLKKTAEKYLRSIQPLLNDSEYKNSEKVIQEFIKDNGVGQMLHKKLIDRYHNTDNWMKKWWLQAAYTGYRLPVIVHSSPGTVGPHQKFSKRDDAYTFAARLIFAANQYNNFVKSGKMKQEMARDIPLDMQPYGMILGSYRQPNYEVDNLLHTDDSNHVVILSNNHFFKIMLQNDSGNYLSEEQLAASIKNISERSQSPGKPVGILTGNDRDSWAKDYMKLKDIGSNEKNLKDLETALFVLCIDKEIPPQAFSNKNYESVRAVQSMTGFSSSTNSANRWHDKTVQFIVSYDGFVGMQYEHSPCEGGPIAVLHDYVLNYISNKKDEELKFSENFPKPELLNFEIDEGLEKSIIKATDIVDKISKDIDMECFIFNEFGSNEIKKCKLSPDSFIQIAMQLTYYKLHSKPPAHYESAALRRFINARTECIRSTCNESVNFAKLMLENKESVDIKKDSMLKAINAHKNIANEAANGEGVDRLFFGLKMLAKEEKIELPKFFNDIGYTKSTYFTLTSSQVAYKTASFMCYGPVVPEGYGCCYNPRSKDILFACSSFKDCPDTCSKSFANTLKESLRTMLNLAQS